MSALELQSVSKSYGPVAAATSVDLRVERGSRTAIVGPSGSGKTTLLRLIAGFELPDAGRIVLDGQVLADATSSIPAHRRGIGFVPQDGALFPHLTVDANIGFGLDGSGPERARRIAELVDMVALDQSLRGRWPHELSGGQQQRVALARALAQRPQLMLLDEPFSALDTGLRAATRKAVAQLLTAEGVTTILVTHDQAEALSFADQLAVMRDGQLVQAGHPMELYLRPSDEATAFFLGEAIVLPAMLAAGWADCALGRIPADDPAKRGPGRIMLRPEQLQVCEGAAADRDRRAATGIVTDIDFGGYGTLLSVRLNAMQSGDRTDDVPDPLIVRSPSNQIPPLGANVWITVRGQAHVLRGE
jgi:iron(III) transport system ATP-binding protein